MSDTKSNWIIGIGGNELDTVFLSRFYGTENGVKKHLVSLVEEEKNDENRGDAFEHGTESVEEVRKQYDGSFYAAANFSYSHMDFVAKLEDELTLYEENDT